MRKEPLKLAFPFIASQFWAFLLLAPELGSITLHGNRFHFHWTRIDLFVCFLGVTVLGLVIFLVGVFIRSTIPRWYSEICVGAAMISLGFLLWEYLVRRSVIPLLRTALAETPLALFAGVVIAAVSWRLGWTPDKWKAGLAALALIFSPTLPLFWLTALTYSTYESSSSLELESPAPSAGAPEDNVFIFIFDAWSHRLTFEDGELTPEFTGLRNMGQELFVFEQARSPSIWTRLSIPRLIYGRDDALVCVDGRIRFRGDTRPAEAMPSVFTKAREYGYRTYMVGWAIPYQALLGSSVDHVRSVPEPRMADESAWRKLMSFYRRDVIKILPAGIIRRTPLTNRGIEIYRRYTTNTEKTLSLVDVVLQEPRDAQFAVFHLPVPHQPFYYNRTGIRPRAKDYYSGDLVEAARQQHAYLDSLIGRFFDMLRSHGKYDKSTIILTSDHTWRRDPGLSQPLTQSAATRVPLFIKLSRQSAGERIASPFSTVHLGEVLDALRRNELDLPEIVARYPFEPGDEKRPADTQGMTFIGR